MLGNLKSRMNILSNPVNTYFTFPNASSVNNFLSIFSEIFYVHIHKYILFFSPFDTNSFTLVCICIVIYL